MQININYTKLFWIFNILGWLLFFSLDVFFNRHLLFQVPLIYSYSSSILVAILLSGLMRNIFQKFSISKLNIRKILLLILIVSIISSFVRFLIDPIFFFIFDVYKNSEKSIIEQLVFICQKKFQLSLLSRQIFFYTYPNLIWSLGYFAIKFFFEFNIEKEKHEKAFLLAQQAQLKMLRYQLNPHFLFNSLSSIQALIYENKNIADKMLTELSEFLRYTLSHVNKTYVPLKEELDAIQKYLTIEKIRFEEKLEFQLYCATDAYNYKVLSFLIQPIIENAIKHGTKTSPIPLQISIEAKIQNNKLTICITNTGRWITSTEEGTGITNLKERLENAYQNRYQFSIKEKEDKVVVSLELEHKE